MKITSESVQFDAKIRKQVLLACLTFCLTLQGIQFIRALFGSAKNDWGYSEFLVNYSSGFIRRGLPGSILWWIDNTFGISPYIFLTIVLASVILSITLLFFYLVYFSNISVLPLVVLSFHPLLLNSSFLSVIMFRKDWFIIFGLICHAFLVRLILVNRITSKFYSKFLIVFILYNLVVIFSHEINILFIFIHLFLISKIAKNLNYADARLIKKLVTVLLASQTLSFLLVTFYHGTASQVLEIIKKMPLSFNLSNTSAILSIGNLPSNQWRDVSSAMFMNTFSILFFAFWFLLGPVLIHVMLKDLDENRSLTSLGLGNLSLAPLATLFLLGNDWGRWIVLISFSVFTVKINDNRLIKSTKSMQLATNKYNKNIFSFKLFSVIFVVGFLFSLVRIPVYAPESINDIWSGVAEFSGLGLVAKDNFWQIIIYRSLPIDVIKLQKCQHLR